MTDNTRHTSIKQFIEDHRNGSKWSGAVVDPGSFAVIRAFRDETIEQVCVSVQKPRKKSDDDDDDNTLNFQYFGDDKLTISTDGVLIVGERMKA